MGELKIKINELKYRKSKNKMVSDEEITILQEELVHLNMDPSNAEQPESIYLKNFRGENLKSYKKAEKASIVGDTVGDPMKDTSGPSLNILIKLSSIISVVFGGLFIQTGYLLN